MSDLPQLLASGRDMTEALIDGERRGLVLAELAQGRMRPKIPDLARAPQGRFDEHHALMGRLHLHHIDHLTATMHHESTGKRKSGKPHTEAQTRRLVAQLEALGNTVTVEPTAA